MTKKKASVEAPDDALKWAAWNGVGSGVRKGSAMALSKQSRAEEAPQD
jgi:hypothetical protein